METDTQKSIKTISYTREEYVNSNIAEWLAWIGDEAPEELKEKVQTVCRRHVEESYDLLVQPMLDLGLYIYKPKENN